MPRFRLQAYSWKGLLLWSRDKIRQICLCQNRKTCFSGSPRILWGYVTCSIGLADDFGGDEDHDNHEHDKTNRDDDDNGTWCFPRILCRCVPPNWPWKRCWIGGHGGPWWSLVVLGQRWTCSAAISPPWHTFWTLDQVTIASFASNSVILCLCALVDGNRIWLIVRGRCRVPPPPLLC